MLDILENTDITLTQRIPPRSSTAQGNKECASTLNPDLYLHVRTHAQGISRLQDLFAEAHLRSPRRKSSVGVGAGIEVGVEVGVGVLRECRYLEVGWRRNVGLPRGGQVLK